MAAGVTQTAFVHFVAAGVLAALASYLVVVYAQDRRPWALGWAVFLGMAALVWGTYAAVTVALGGLWWRLDLLTDPAWG